MFSDFFITATSLDFFLSGLHESITLKWSTTLFNTVLFRWNVKNANIGASFKHEKLTFPQNIGEQRQSALLSVILKIVRVPAIFWKHHCSQEDILSGLQIAINIILRDLSSEPNKSFLYTWILPLKCKS